MSSDSSTSGRPSCTQVYPCFWNYCPLTLPSRDALRSHFMLDHFPHVKKEIIPGQRVRRHPEGGWIRVGSPRPLADQMPIPISQTTGDITTTTESTQFPIPSFASLPPPLSFPSFPRSQSQTESQTHETEASQPLPEPEEMIPMTPLPTAIPLGVILPPRSRRRNHGSGRVTPSRSLSPSLSPHRSPLIQSLPEGQVESMLGPERATLKTPPLVPVSPSHRAPIFSQSPRYDIPAQSHPLPEALSTFSHLGPGPYPERASNSPFVPVTQVIPSLSSPTPTSSHPHSFASSIRSQIHQQANATEPFLSSSSADASTSTKWRNRASSLSQLPLTFGAALPCLLKPDGLPDEDGSPGSGVDANGGVGVGLGFGLRHGYQSPAQNGQGETAATAGTSGQIQRTPGRKATSGEKVGFSWGMGTEA